MALKAVLGYEIGKELLEALGLPTFAIRVTIDVPADDVVTATVTYFVDKPGAKKLIELVRNGFKELKKGELKTESYELVHVPKAG